MPFLRDQLLDLLGVAGKARAQRGVGSRADAPRAGHRREQWIRNLRGLLGEDLILVDFLKGPEFLVLARDVRRAAFLFILSATALGETFSSFSRSTGLAGCLRNLRLGVVGDRILLAGVQQRNRLHGFDSNGSAAGVRARRKNRDASSPNYRCPYPRTALHAK